MRPIILHKKGRGDLTTNGKRKKGAIPGLTPSQYRGNTTKGEYKKRTVDRERREKGKRERREKKDPVACWEEGKKKKKKGYYHTPTRPSRERKTGELLRGKGKEGRDAVLNPFYAEPEKKTHLDGRPVQERIRRWPFSSYLKAKGKRGRKGGSPI